ncbi:hypothetical protein CHELA1G11_21311 [Hyphomicrobiales bacterium]|nr:hypothetical protein CHELA1G11_21311 [Hyphomicrobiales bacterium]CAH1694163.1 hypothetical protein CHELA1G2_21617 [Hyphomicrobiales bacterium]
MVLVLRSRRSRWIVGVRLAGAVGGPLRRFVDLIQDLQRLNQDFVNSGVALQGKYQESPESQQVEKAKRKLWTNLVSNAYEIYFWAVIDLGISMS